MSRAPDDPHLKTLIELSSNAYYWEQDKNYRFTRVSGAIFDKAGIDTHRFHGKTRWDLGWMPTEGDWEKHRALLDARESFTDFIFRYSTPAGEARFISTSGQPMYDRRGGFKGYRGISRDVTRRVHNERRLQIEREVAQILATASTSAEAATRIIEATCRTLGWVCGAHWEIDAQDQGLRCVETWRDDAQPTIESFLRATRAISPLDVSADGLIRRACARGEPVWLADVGQEPSFRRAADARRAGLRGAFAFPIKAGTSIVGAIEFFGREPHQPDPELLKGAAYIGEGIGQFISRRRAEDELLRFRAAMDLSGDAIYLVDRATMRFVDLNETACRLAGRSREAMLQLGPQDLLLADRGAIERDYDAVIAKGSSGVRSESSARAKDGREVVVELHRRALNVAGRWLIVTISRDITRRKRAEQSALRLGRMYAALSATTDAIMRARSPEELYKRVCDAAVHGGRINSCSVFLADRDAQRMRVAASTGAHKDVIRDIPISTDPQRPEGRGLIGTAVHTQAPCICNDLLNDERTLPWRAAVIKSGSRAGAALPILRGGSAIGVLAFYSAELNAFDEDIVKLLEHMAANISFALDNFDRDAERAQAEQAVRDSDERFRALTALSSDWYWEQDTEFRFTRFGRHDEDADNSMGKRVIGKHPWQTGVAEDGWDAHRATLLAHKPFRDVVMHNKMRDGITRYFAASGEPIFDDHGRFCGYRGVARDITEKKIAEERIQYLATHDGLTGLPNRVMFGQLLSIAIESAKRYGRGFAVLFVDLDRFKVINDTLGHEAGDKLLQEIAGRLKQVLRASDIIGRFGGDEFVVLLQEAADRSQVAVVARKILSAALKPMTLVGQECRVTASIGIAMYPGDADGEQALMKNADIAMYQAKEQGKNTFEFFSQTIKTQSLERLTFETSLRHALERDEFSLHYQPKLDLRTGAITGVEALLRWHQPDLGMVSPVQFIPLAEETGLIVPIGKWVLNTACAQSVAWQREGLPPICMAVNLSVRQFSDANLLADIDEALRHSGLAPQLLELEITEGMVMQNPERATKVLAAIKDMGVRLAIDDFGTGYSSLAQIKRFPIDTLKVDRSFIREIPEDAEDKAITEAIIAMGKTLSLTVVAEGVETLEQATFLREHACDEMQGYYFSKPVEPEKFAQLLRTHTHATA